ncbi:MAG TPA: TonB-dependent receptor [Sphingomonas sp.]|nr:TonB-dependent receptor [Sphingomonas sp.]
MRNLSYLTLALIAAPAFAEPAKDADDGGDIVVTARKLDEARDQIQPSLGASEYKITRAQLDLQPGGPDRSLRQVLLQAPGVTQDADGDGEIHVRNEHGNLQYRLNGVIVPESISGFGQAFDARVANSVELVTGTLPAQYGYRTAGVVTLTTRTDAFDLDGDIGVYGGSRGTFQPSATLRDSIGNLNFFLSGSYLRNDLGVENPMPTRNAIHDRTEQFRGFGYASLILSDSARLSAFGGAAVGKFQIPNVIGEPGQYTLNGVSTYDSTKLDQNQREWTYYGVTALQIAADPFNLQIAPFIRYSRTHFTPDPNGGDLILAGSADNSRLSSLAAGIQADGSYKLSNAHTLRAGLFFQNERTRNTIVSRVFAVDANGAQASDQPLSLTTVGGRSGQLYGVYLQDEWKPAEGLTINYGARFDVVRAYAREQQLSPRLNLVYQTGGTTFHAGYARTFTPPPQELIAAADFARFAGTTRAPEILTGDPVRSEREHYFDAGVQQKLGFFTLGIDGYYKLKRNLLDDGQFGASLVQSPFNYAKGYAWGVEFRADYTRGPLSLYANVARGQEKGKNIVSSQYFFGRDELDYIRNHYIFTDHSQKWTVSAGGSVSIKDGIGTLTPAVDILYGSGLRRDDPAGVVPNGGVLPSYITANLGVGQSFGDGEKAFTLRVDVVNLFDKSYLLRDGSGVGVGAPQYAARRGFFVGLRKSF